MDKKTQWDKIFEDHITKESLENLENFKSSRVNHKISLWNPSTNGLRYLKMLIYNLFDTLSDRQRAILSSCQNRDVGNPISVEKNGNKVCLDYIQSCLEADFIEKNIRFNNSTVLEIGAGYGRTCHTLISNFDISSYTICDIGGCLKLSRNYLKQVLDVEQYEKITFVTPENLFKKDFKFDLCINIDSFAEMETEIVFSYLGFIDRNCLNLYVKNPVGKYIDNDISGDKDPESISLALQSGILKSIIDIHSEISISQKSEEFINAYKPSSFWQSQSSSWAPPIPYYWQSFYKKEVV